MLSSQPAVEASPGRCEASTFMSDRMKRLPLIAAAALALMAPMPGLAQSP